MILIDESLAKRQREALDRLTAAIDGSRAIAICAHTSPDGDALGSELALASIIEDRWRGEKAVTCLLADDKPLPRHCAFLPGAERLVRPSDYDGVPDLFICVDLCLASRLAAARPIMERSGSVFIIDHHPTDRPFADCWIRPNVAACGVIVAEYALQMGMPITPDVATLLFVALVTDTGRFQYQNADAEAFGIASLLVDSGASPSEVALQVYQSFSLPYLHLESIVEGRIRLLLDGRLALSWALWEDFIATGCPEDEADGLVDVVRSVGGAEVVLLLRQTPSGAFRGNLRSKGALDVSKVAERLGGGGHAAAAGFTLDADDVREAEAAVVPLVARLIDGSLDGDGEWDRVER